MHHLPKLLPDMAQNLQGLEMYRTGCPRHQLGVG